MLSRMSDVCLVSSFKGKSQRGAFVFREELFSIGETDESDGERNNR